MLSGGASSVPSKPPSFLLPILFFTVLSTLIFYSLHHPHPIRQNPFSSFLSFSSNSTLSDYLYALTRHPHLAGTPSSLHTSSYVSSFFQSLNLPTHSLRYTPLLSYPTHSSLSAVLANGSSLHFSLTEPNVSPAVIIPYHAYSPAGSVHAKVVFANYGRHVDYGALIALGVNVSGCVVLVKKGGVSRGGVVRIAESYGAHAVLLYADGESFPGGIERGTVMRGVGDPLTPGWAAVDGGERLPAEEAEVLNRFPKIPSLPISLENADVILGSLSGSLAPADWTSSGRKSGIRVGPGSTLVNFTYQGEKRVASIENVLTVIRGAVEPDRYVILGNHRDAWTYGAVDPNSGTAAMLDIARRFALLIKMGWKPRRTIILCSWDAEEFGMVGSTEWVEQNLVNLGAKAVAYLNVDCAVQGPGFFAGATPQLDDLLFEVMKRVQDPDSMSATVYDQWVATNDSVTIQRLSEVDSDFAPFLQHAGVPSVDIYYGKDFPVYHTAFDSYEWMKSNADPFFHRHVAVTEIWGLLALHLADDSILSFNYLSYAKQLQIHTDALHQLLDGDISLNPLTASIRELASAAKEAEDEAKQLRKQESNGVFIALKLRALNDRLMAAERGFLEVEGLEGRQWFKHLIYGPPNEYESKLRFFPGIADALSRSTSRSRENQEAAIQHEIWRAARSIHRAARALRGELT